MTDISMDRRLKWLVCVFGGALLLIWLWITPPGLLGKVDALGYAVCHRIADHSFFMADRQLPLCARCSGMYLGALIGLAYFLPRCRKAGFPPVRIQLVFGIFIIAFALDGVNSFADLLNGSPALYPPQNSLRLLSGTMVGLAASAILTAAVGQSVWREYQNVPALGGFRLLGGLVGVGLLADMALLSDNTLLVYPLAILSGITIPVFLGLAYSILWMSLAKRWNSFENWRGVWPFIGLGLCTALSQILITDLLRLAFTGTWSGFNL
jgi:uncharacterized membrane protein